MRQIGVVGVSKGSHGKFLQVIDFTFFGYTPVDQLLRSGTLRP